ncbi:MAG: hypothetical protein HY675_14970, partial [Chloroflexi bacterium]|nr:hypothetical protein [Chloroflexota bacterium]
MATRWLVFALVFVVFLAVSASAAWANKTVPQENQPASSLVAGEPSARYGHSMVNLNGKVYLFGGATAYVSD